MVSDPRLARAPDPRPRWRRDRPRLTVISLLAMLSLAAAPSDADMDRAREKMEQGDSLAAHKDFASALRLYEQADAIMAVPSTGIAVARTLRELGRWKEARAKAVDIVRQPPDASEPAAFVKARVEAAQLMADLEQRIPTLQLKVQLERCQSSARVALDGSPVSAEPGAPPLWMDPGDHDVHVVADGCSEVTEHIALRAGDRRVLVLHLAPAHLSSQDGAKAHRSTGRTLSPVVYIGMAVAGTGVIVGTVSGLLSLSKASDAKSQCQGNICPYAAKSDADAAIDLAHVSDVSFGVGLVGAAVGIIGLLASPNGGTEGAAAKSQRSAVQPWIGYNHLGLSGRFH